LKFLTKQTLSQRAEIVEYKRPALSEWSRFLLAEVDSAVDRHVVSGRLL